MFKNLGAKTHYENLTKGIMHLNDLIYFFGLSIVFFVFGIALIKKEQN